jgi:hypothetical protein
MDAALTYCDNSISKRRDVDRSVQILQRAANAPMFQTHGHREQT